MYAIIKFAGVVFLLLLSNSQIISAQSHTASFYIATWNVENLFDTVDDPNTNDSEFLPDGKKEWTDSRLAAKTKNMAKVIRYINIMDGPDLLGIQEVEHESLLTNMIAEYFCDKNYKIVYAESLDKRGIDNALIYNADIFQLLDTKNIEIVLDNDRTTRYILYSKLLLESSDTIHVFVNHWPSRSGGQEKSEPNRIKAAETLNHFIKENDLNNKVAKIIIVGDFNDEPENISIKEWLKAANGSYDSDDSTLLVNLAYNAYQDGEGSYLYRGDWNMLDQIIVSRSIFENNEFNYFQDSFEVIKPYFMITGEGKYKDSAIPTYGGNTYLGGFSDHYPVGIKISYFSQH